MGRGFGVGDLSGLRAGYGARGEDLDDAAARTAGLAVGRHGVLNPATARAVQVLWTDWTATVAEHAIRCMRLAAAVAEVSRDYRATDSGVAGYPYLSVALTFTSAARTRAASVDVVDGPLMADPGDAFAGMVASCQHLSMTSTPSRTPSPRCRQRSTGGVPPPTPHSPPSGT
jgi:hypothetical protein